MKKSLKAFGSMINICQILIGRYNLYSLTSCAFAPVNKPILKKDKAPVKGFYNISSKELFKYSSLALENMGYKIVKLDLENGEIH